MVKGKVVVFSDKITADFLAYYSAPAAVNLSSVWWPLIQRRSGAGEATDGCRRPWGQHHLGGRCRSLLAPGCHCRGLLCMGLRLIKLGEPEACSL